MPANNANISSYSATDLIRYATGRMSGAEMHALEKAALEDPLLAEALEGYMDAAATQPEKVLADQASRLNAFPNKKEVKIIPLWRRKAVQLAVAACFVAGAGWFLFSLLQKPATTSNEVAAVQETSRQKPSFDSNAAYEMLAADSSTAYQPAITDSGFESSLLVAQNRDIVAKPAAPATFSLQQTEANNYSPAGEMKQNLERPAMAKLDTVTVNATPNEPTGTIASLQQRDERAMRQVAASPVPQHIFRGKITDSSNNPLPYSNIMIEGQDFGTYSDTFGNFNFISADSILPVRVHSVGFLNQAVALKEGKQFAKIVMREDKLLNDRLPLTVQQKDRRQATAMKSIVENDSLLGADLAGVGIPFYDNYLLNNNRISKLPNLNREVQLRFEVTPTGEPANITIVKSSGKTLDEEAIRLIKEGPKLTPASSTRSKRKVTVRF